jgi:hypothetical protein
VTRPVPFLAAAVLAGAFGPVAVTDPAHTDQRTVPPRRCDQKAGDQDGVETVAGVVKAVLAEKAQLVLTVEEDGAHTDRTVPVAPRVPVRFGKAATTLADLRPGMTVELSYKGNSTDLLGVRATWPQREVVFKAADPATRSFSIETGGDEGGFETVLHLTPDAKVMVDELPAGLADVPAGAKTRVDLALDRKGVLALEADGLPDTLPVLVKRYEPGAPTGTLYVEVRAAGFRRDRVATIGLPLAAGVRVRYAGHDAALTDLRDRMPARLTFSPDRRTVTTVLVAAPLPPEVNDDD